MKFIEFLNFIYRYKVSIDLITNMVFIDIEASLTFFEVNQFEESSIDLLKLQWLKTIQNKILTEKESIVHYFLYDSFENDLEYYIQKFEKIVDNQVVENSSFFGFITEDGILIS